MERNKFDLIIPVVYKDYGMLDRVLQYVVKYISPDNIYIITDARYRKYLPKEARRMEVVDENVLLPGLSFFRIKSLLKQSGNVDGRPGWYLQQFIKMGFALSDYSQNQYYLSWDADTIPLRKLDFFVDGKVMFAMKKEFHKPYFDTIKRILDISEFNEKSYIAEHMMFDKQIMADLIGRISSCGVRGEDWIEKIINAVEPGVSNGFSEFETYGNFCLNYYPQSYVERHLNTFRKGGYIAGRFISKQRLEYISFDTDTISLELNDYPDVWTARCFCFLYRKYVEMRYRWISHILPPPFYIVNKY